jgi:hypothetical protein
MKCLFLIFSILSFGFSSMKETPNDFDSKLSDIVREFKQEIMNKDECEKQKREADGLADDIENAIKMEGEYTTEEVSNLRKLKEEAEAIEEYIAAVGNCGNYIPSIDNLNLANRRVNGKIVNILKDKFCIDVISVTIGEYVAFLGENATTKNYKVVYKWKAQNGMDAGNGTMGLSKMSVRHIYDNREKPNQKSITVFGIVCKEF